MKDDGEVLPGMTLNLNVIKNAPFFDPNILPASSFANSFEIDTQPDFTAAEAGDNNYMIGPGRSTSGGSKTPAAVFIPQSNVKYQIQPVNTYYIAYGDYTPGVLIDVTKLGQTVLVDFAHHKATVNIVHTEHGQLVLQVN
ncbi:hypothetical protein MMC13_004670 [Lambiella insularis]|nr:hypothetical protein [Lambiella insularis]